MEIFRNNTDIREIIVSKDQNPYGLEMTQIFEMLYQNKHFLNRKYNIKLINSFIVLGDMLTKRPATTKIERFFMQ